MDVSRVRQCMADPGPDPTLSRLRVSGERDVRAERKAPMVRKSITRPLHFQGIDRCDLCGAPLAPGDAITGLCKKHQRSGRRANGSG